MVGDQNCHNNRRHVTHQNRQPIRKGGQEGLRCRKLSSDCPVAMLYDKKMRERNNLSSEEY